MKLRTETQQFLLFRSFTRLRALHGELYEHRHLLKKDPSYARAQDVQKTLRLIKELAQAHRDVWVIIDTRTNEATLRGEPLRPTGTLSLVRK